MRGHILVIAEKPKAAEKIALALGVPKKYRKYNVPYWVLNNGNKIVVASAAGHLFGLAPKSSGFPVFEYDWRPLYEVDRDSSHTKKFIALLSSLSKDAKLYVNACDYDIEGSVIGFMIIKNFGDLKRAKRMVFHALTPQELRKAWRNLRSLDWEMIEAGLARHELDWLWGINVSRALMRAYKAASKKNRSLSAGRVQSPTLNEVVKKEIEIGTFVPLPYFLVTLKADGFTLEPTLKFNTKDEASVWSGTCKGKVIKVVENEEKYNPPHPFNLPDLQMEAARLYGFSPAKTQSIAEDLYLDAYISYPRTNSQKYPKDLDYEDILKHLMTSQYSGLVKALRKETKGIYKPNNGPKDDPAHPAIYPTGKVPKSLDRDHMRVYDLIIRRFMATLASPSKYLVKKVTIEVKNKQFRIIGKKRIWMGWTLYYPYSAPEEKPFPPYKEGDNVLVKCSLKTQYTKPPERFTKAKIVKWMEKVGIGTEATRARIVETLFKRGYLKVVHNKVYATDLGMGVALVLSTYFPEIVSVELTRKFEEEMQKIRMGKKKRKEVVDEAKNVLKMLMEKYKPHLKEVGQKLAQALGDIEPESKCKLCHREARENGLCYLHFEAYKNILEAYSMWKARLGISFKDYLRKLSKMKEAGIYVRDIASGWENVFESRESINKEQ